MKVVWDHGKSIEITLPTQYKNKSCGLCGNYNGDPDDDYMTKRKKTVDKVERFAYAWRVRLPSIDRSITDYSIVNEIALTGGKH